MTPRPRKATLEQLRRHNRQLLLRAVFEGTANNRAALAQATGLTKPTVSDLIGELLEEGFLSEGGRGSSGESGGKRPTLVRFRPDARQLIGVAVDSRRIFAALSNLTGQISARHYAELTVDEGDPIKVIREVVNALLAQLDAPLLCIGVGVPGTIDSRKGVVQHSALGWHDLQLVAPLAEHYGVPVHLGNGTELQALAQFTFGANGEKSPRNLVTILVNDGVEVGVTFEHGSYHHGSDISSLILASSDGRSHTLREQLGKSSVERCVEDLRRYYPDTSLPPQPSYLHIRYCAYSGDAAAQQLCADLSFHLAQVVVWVLSLLRPDHISLAGPIAQLGPPFLEAVIGEAKKLLPEEALRSVNFSLADADDLSVLGAIALVLKEELALL